VTENVSPEEVEALVGADETTSPEAVELRDFRQPRRLSQARQSAIRDSLARRMPQIELELSNWLRSEITASLGGIGEASALGLFDGQEDPMAILTVEVDGTQGWIVWDNLAAQRAVHAALGAASHEDPAASESESERPKPRLLSHLETGLVTDIAGILVNHLEELLGFKIKIGALSQTLREFVAQHEADPGGDPQRLFLHIDLEGLGEPSILRLYLPGVLPRAERQPGVPVKNLPQHLNDVPLELGAVLGRAEVQLADLMRIEVGDVIPLHTPVGSPIDVLIEGNRAGSARWGSHRGRLALSIECLEGIKMNPTSHD
jgi:flagellar motor switch protein FliM